MHSDQSPQSHPYRTTPWSRDLLRSSNAEAGRAALGMSNISLVVDGLVPDVQAQDQANTDKINAALARAATLRAGKVIIPGGYYFYKGYTIPSNLRDVEIECQGGQGLTLGSSGTVLVHTGTGSTPIVNAHNRYGITWRGGSYAYLFDGFTGHVFDISEDTPIWNKHRFHDLEILRVGGVNATADAGIYNRHCIDASYHGIRIAGVKNGVRGSYAGDPMPLETAVHKFFDCDFVGCTEAAILNPSSFWEFFGGGIEPGAFSGSNFYPSPVKSEDATRICQNVNFYGFFWSDITAAGEPLIELHNSFNFGIYGGSMGVHNGKCIRLHTAVSPTVTGVLFSGDAGVIGIEIVTSCANGNFGTANTFINFVSGNEFLGSDKCDTWTTLPANLPALPNKDRVGETRLLYKYEANMSITTDQVMTKMTNFQNAFCTAALVTDANISMSTAVGGIYPAAAKAGSPLIAASQTYSALTDNAAVLELTRTKYCGKLFGTVAPVISLTTAQPDTVSGADFPRATFWLFGMVIN